MQVDYRLFVNRSLPPQERGCTSKSYFVSRAEAKSVLRSGRHAISGLQPYRCRYCDGWHLGHRRPAKLVTVRAQRRLRRGLQTRLVIATGFRP